jgi:pyruvate dehydrogenase E2 component (dihydrolipoamide acetyltransferase)
MITKIKSPKVSANVEEETITAWFRKEGESIEKGEPLVEITTDKAAVEVPAPRSGVLRRIVAPEKSTVPVGYTIALLGPAGDPLPDVEAENSKLLEVFQRSSHATRKAPAAAAAGATRDRVRATPSARRLARELGVDLGAVAAVGGDGIVSEDAVRAFAKRAST